MFILMCVFDYLFVINKKVESPGGDIPQKFLILQQIFVFIELINFS